MIEMIPYDPQWVHMFEQESAVIKQALGENCITLHHVGSTSVPGLIAKPKIDIIAVVKNILNIKDNPCDLESAGYVGKGELNIPFRYFFSKREKALKVNLHVYEEGGPGIELNLLFRDHLRTHPKACADYANLKIALATQDQLRGPNEHRLNGYNLGKNDFIRDVLKQAGFEGVILTFCSHDKEWEVYHRIKKEQIFVHLPIIYDQNHPSLTDKNHFHFVLSKGVDIVCIAHIEFLNSNEVALRGIATDTPFKRMGFGTHMMTLLEKWIKQQERNVIKVHAAKRAEGFYRSLGYKDMPFDDVSISTDVIDLGKRLSVL